jgi:predicted nucleic acid-binding protein
MRPKVAVLDANVLYPASLRDLLLQLAFAGLYQARWSLTIEEEWTRNLLLARPDLARQIERTRIVMRAAIPNALVSDYERLIAQLVLPDPNDRHVLAAAIEAEAEAVVTFNTRDFPQAYLSPHGLVAQHPDMFLADFCRSQPAECLAAVSLCVTRLRKPPVAAGHYLSALRRLQLAETADFLEHNLSAWQP